MIVKRNRRKKKQINLTIDTSHANDVFADEDMVNSIIQNLLSNAVKFTDHGGDIKIFSRKITSLNGPDVVEIIVEDTGVGIAEKVLSKLFKDTITSTPGTDKEYGTGLGLLLVKEFVEKNGGTIFVRSKINRGSSFIFTLPAVQ